MYNLEFSTLVKFYFDELSAQEIDRIRDFLCANPGNSEHVATAMKDIHSHSMELNLQSSRAYYDNMTEGHQRMRLNAIRRISDLIWDVKRTNRPNQNKVHLPFRYISRIAAALIFLLIIPLAINQNSSWESNDYQLNQIKEISRSGRDISLDFTESHEMFDDKQKRRSFEELKNRKKLRTSTKKTSNQVGIVDSIPYQSPIADHDSSQVLKELPIIEECHDLVLDSSVFLNSQVKLLSKRIIFKSENNSLRITFNSQTLSPKQYIFDFYNIYEQHILQKSGVCANGMNTIDLIIPGNNPSFLIVRSNLTSEVFRITL